MTILIGALAVILGIVLSVVAVFMQGWLVLLVFPSMRHLSGWPKLFVVDNMIGGIIAMMVLTFITIIGVSGAPMFEKIGQFILGAM